MYSLLLWRMMIGMCNVSRALLRNSTRGLSFHLANRLLQEAHLVVTARRIAKRLTIRSKKIINGGKKNKKQRKEDTTNHQMTKTKLFQIQKMRVKVSSIQMFLKLIQNTKRIIILIL